MRATRLTYRRMEYSMIRYSGSGTCALCLTVALTVAASLLPFKDARAVVSESLPAAQNGSMETAFSRFRVRAATGDADAQMYFGELYRHGLDVTGDPAKAFGWYLRAARQGNTRGQSRVGSAYYLGIGVLKDFSKAGKWLLRAAHKGDAPAIQNLGKMFAEGSGVALDPVRAYMWFTVGARLGDLESRKLGSDIRSKLTTLEIQRALDMVNSQLSQFQN